jgi:hypothetical protein
MMMRGLFRVGWMLSLVGSAWAQDVPKPRSISDVTLFTVGDASGLDQYRDTISKAIKQAWIDRWSSETPEPGRLVVTLRINHAGYLESMLASEFVPTIALPHSDLLSRTGDRVPARLRREQQISVAIQAVDKVFTGLPPAPTDEYSHQIVVKVVFVFGTDKPQL